MPHAEFEANDPLEFHGMCVPGNPREMARALVEEFALTGMNPERILALFRAPHYRAAYELYRTLGESTVRGEIESVFGREVR